MGEFRFMDLLYSRYASPMDLMNLYLDQGRFGELVENIIELENKRKQEEAEKENDKKLWSLYVHSMESGSFNDWKAKVLEESRQKSKGGDANMTDDDVVNILNDVFEKK